MGLLQTEFSWSSYVFVEIVFKGCIHNPQASIQEFIVDGEYPTIHILALTVYSSVIKGSFWLSNILKV